MQSGSVFVSDLIVPSKQKRIITGGSKSSSVPLCKVHGCNKSLVSCKDYHRRHKVCESHSKTAKVIVNGIEQRFCQQCSRFHLLSEFDEGKRSCRKRLADHNERRRKKPHSSHYGNGRLQLPPYNPKGIIKLKGSSTRAKSSSMCNDEVRAMMSSVTEVQQNPWLNYGDYNGYAAQASSSSVLFPYLNNQEPTYGEDDFITMDSTCALSLLSTASSNSCHSSRNPTSSSSWPHPFSHELAVSGVSNNINSSEYMNSENGLWCDDVSTVDLLQLPSQLDQVELHKEIFLTNCQN